VVVGEGGDVVGGGKGVGKGVGRGRSCNGPAWVDEIRWMILGAYLVLEDTMSLQRKRLCTED